MNPTPKQLKILQAIDEWRRRDGYSPTMQELADQLGVSKVTVFEHVQALERKGLLDRQKHKARSLNLSPRAKLPASSSSGILPLMGSIAAGKPIEAIENPDNIDLRDLFSSRSQTFMLRVRGDSMIEDHIADGDMVIAEQRTTARDGEIVVALLEDGSATLKRFYRENGRIRLQPANGSMQPIYIDGDLKIQGVVIGVLRRYGRSSKVG
ncbi:MAG: transcriptional repressor LexA [Phycisphaerae bacterium]